MSSPDDGRPGLAITRYITRLSDPAATVPLVTDLALPSPPPVVEVYASTRPPTAAVADELVNHLIAELPALAALDDRDRLLAAAWLASLRSARTRRSYAGDLLGWQVWLAERSLELLGAARVHVNLWVRAQQHAGAGDASVRRRLSGIGSFYRYCLSHDLATADPTAGVARPGRGWIRTTPRRWGCRGSRGGR